MLSAHLRLALIISQHIKNMSTGHQAQDEFELYDLRVEAICPTGKRIYCGAKEGDYFELRGEMLHLPPDQGFSIFSICE